MKTCDVELINCCAMNINNLNDHIQLTNCNDINNLTNDTNNNANDFDDFGLNHLGNERRRIFQQYLDFSDDEEENDDLEE